MSLYAKKQAIAQNVIHKMNLATGYPYDFK